MKVKSKEIHIVTKKNGNQKIYTKGSYLKKPFIEKVDILNTDLLEINIKSENIITTQDFVNVKIQLIAYVKISDNIEDIQLSKKYFSNTSTNEIKLVSYHNIEGSVRETIGEKTLKELITEQKTIIELIKEKTQKKLKNFGIKLIEINIINVIDIDKIILIEKRIQLIKDKGEPAILEMYFSSIPQLIEKIVESINKNNITRNNREVERIIQTTVTSFFTTIKTKTNY